MKRAVFKNRRLPYLLVLPQLAVTLAFFFWPAFESLRLSFFRTSPFGDKRLFIGLDNFRKLVVDPEYYRSILNSFVFASGVTALALGTGLFVAALATQKVRGLAMYRAAVLWPYGIAPPVAGIIFLFIFHPSYGVLPYWLSFVTAYEFNWLLKGWVAMALVVVATAWTHVGYNIAFFLAGLLAIPASVLEAASVDGAGPVRRFRSIVFPLLSPITFYLLVVNMIFAFFGAFGVIHAVTQGGPSRATEIMVFKAYKDGFIGLNLGSSAAQSVVLMVVVIVLTALQFRFVEKRVTY
ncbi:MAG: glycerol-3-phosphate transporter permease [Candidatus Rokubacteria bacterium 13_1_40CM_4_69_39]|nr:MAG: glycerol-3-phosphate transporter permease [Candidatus Rokubacteria bacterium 13_1_40CM_69_96]OLC53129.1 MAG: glycerol-3-phosphate transporter permease [Candidatus Rokubacteria bacterium 13_1_40CM_4_69_39]OLC90590.1 MAG: glycerol-3-phosphate transporter permease [Candidatus Rokubacteria bacterium 13_1_40CM_3_69_38]OLD29131.1 MAG: glycerol-3-phosphate transporter permease [Candidatus Rokubacteria bacterium 13_1_40CM_2_70_45]OLD76726.1 MAG: glycerol-3-phosphate transporter permease [Candid